jgi:hypothetical protein
MTSQFNLNRTNAFNTLSDKKNVIQNTYKSKMCNEYLQTGKCRFGNTCHFAHSEAERRKPPCVFKHACKNKATCPYDHGENLPLPEIKPAVISVAPVNKQQATFRTRLCDKFMKTGHCPYGETCHYAHGECKLRKTPCRFGPSCTNKMCQFDHSGEIIEIPKAKNEENNLIIYFDNIDDEYEEEIEEIYISEEEEIILEKIKRHQEEQYMNEAMAKMAL